MEYRDAVANVRRAWEACTPEERHRGVCWYGDAFDSCCHIADVAEISRYTVVGVVAALSPSLAWKQNLAAARNAVHKWWQPGMAHGDVRVQGYPRNVAKAERIMRGASPLSVLRGRKVVSFYHLIVSRGTSGHVCVDGHAANIALGRGRLRLDVSDVSPHEYALCDAAYRSVAYAVGVEPCTVQAATWLAWRSSHGFRQGRVPFDA